MNDVDWLIILIIFTIVFSIAFAFGFVYDRIFKLWAHLETVGIERNPYQKGRINPSELIMWQFTFIPLLLKGRIRAFL